MNLFDAEKILNENGYIIEYSKNVNEDFGCSVATCGADQGIPHGGDMKAVIPVRMDGGRPVSRFRKKIKAKKKIRK